MTFPNLTTSQNEHLDQVQLTGLLMSCVIGIFPNERHRKQPVTADLCLYLNTRKAARTTNIQDTIDYAAAVKEISFILEQCEFLLIESAVDAVCRYFVTMYSADHQLPQVEAASIRISKPSALTHGIVPTVQILRRREEYPELLQANDPTRAFILHHSSHGSLELRSVPAGTRLSIGCKDSGVRAALTLGKWAIAGGDSLRLRTHLSLGDAASTQPLTLIHDQPTPQRILVLRAPDKIPAM